MYMYLQETVSTRASNVHEACRDETPAMIAAAHGWDAGAVIRMNTPQLKRRAGLELELERGTLREQFRTSKLEPTSRLKQGTRIIGPQKAENPQRNVMQIWASHKFPPERSVVLPRFAWVISDQIYPSVDDIPRHGRGTIYAANLWTYDGNFSHMFETGDGGRIRPLTADLLDQLVLQTPDLPPQSGWACGWVHAVDECGCCLTRCIGTGALGGLRQTCQIFEASCACEDDECRPAASHQAGYTNVGNHIQRYFYGMRNEFKCDATPQGQRLARELRQHGIRPSASPAAAAAAAWKRGLEPAFSPKPEFANPRLIREFEAWRSRAEEEFARLRSL
jgi:hypothetical protein